jgi:hypothetical protein
MCFQHDANTYVSGLIDTYNTTGSRGNDCDRSVCCC